MCTTVPPAKSRAPRLNSQPVGAKTQWATGAYTRVDHRARKSAHPANFIRSAVAPVMRAGVMMANIIWKATNASAGTVSASRPGMLPLNKPLRPTRSKPPITPPWSLPKARLKATNAHSTLTSPMQKTFCMSMPRTFLPLTIPP